MAFVKDWRGWVWPLAAGALVLAIAAAGVLTTPRKAETRAQYPPAYVREAALAAAAKYGDDDPVAVEWITTRHRDAARVVGLHDGRAGYRRDVLILVQGDFRASPGVPPGPDGQQRSAWLALLYSTGRYRQDLGFIGAYAERPDTAGLRALKRYEW